MTRKSHSRQYCFRISLDNPEHLRVYRTLEDLNLNIHKSISSFVVKALLAYIKSADDSELTNTGMAEKDRQEVIITKEYIDKIKPEQESQREEEKPDAALEEMSVLFSQGGFGEE